MYIAYVIHLLPEIHSGSYQTPLKGELLCLAVMTVMEAANVAAVMEPAKKLWTEASDPTRNAQNAMTGTENVPPVMEAAKSSK